MEDRQSRFENKLAGNLYDQLLQERARKRPISRPSSRLIGTCCEMCPEFERHQRELHLDVSKFELLEGDRPDETFPPRIDHRKAVKKYHRPAAGNELPLPEDVRPPKTLRKTLAYLFHEIMDNADSLESLIEAQKFVRDRTRAIRQDLSIQDIRDSEAVEISEQIARFHIAIDNELRGKADKAEYDSFQNTEQLRKVLLTLLELYEDGYTSASEGEMRAYHILSHLENPDNFHRSVSGNFPEVRLAVKLAVSYHSGNYTGYFVLMEDAPFLMACLANLHADRLRRKAIQIISKSYSQELSVERFSDALCFETTPQAISYLHSLKVPVLDGVVLKHDEAFPDEPVFVQSASILRKRATLKWSDIAFDYAKISSTLHEKVARDAFQKASAICFDKRQLCSKVSKEFMRDLINGVARKLGYLIAKEAWISINNDQSYAHFNTRKRVVGSVYADSIETPLLNNQIRSIVHNVYWYFAEKARVSARSCALRRLSSLLFEQLVLSIFSELAPIFSRSLAEADESTLAPTRGLEKEYCFSPNGQCALSNSYITRLSYHLPKRAFELGHRIWDLLLVGSYPRVKCLLELFSSGYMPDTEASSIRLVATLLYGGSSVRIFWHDGNSVVLGETPPNAIIYLCDSAISHPNASVYHAENDPGLFHYASKTWLVFQYLLESSNPWPFLVRLNVLNRWYAKFIIRCDDDELSPVWKRVKESLVELLSPSHYPWADHPLVKHRNISSLMDEVESWDVSAIVDGVEFCNEHPLNITCVYNKLLDIELRNFSFLDTASRRPSLHSFLDYGFPDLGQSLQQEKQHSSSFEFFLEQIAAKINVP